MIVSLLPKHKAPTAQAAGSFTARALSHPPHDPPEVLSSFATPGCQETNKQETKKKGGKNKQSTKQNQEHCKNLNSR